MSRCSKISLVGAAACIGALFLAAPASADQSPAGCNANTLNLTLSRSTGLAVPGQIVTFGVSVAVPATDGAGVPACDTKNVTIFAQCPDAANNIPPTTAVQNLVTGQDYPAGTPPTSVGSINCAMPNVPTTGVVSAYSQANGLLQDTDVIPAGSPFSRNNSITVTIQPCQVKVDKQVSCDNGASWVDPGLVTNNEDGTLDCKIIGLTGPVKVQYQVSNTGSCVLTQCALTETNDEFGTPPAVGDLKPGQTTNFLPAEKAPACSTAYGDPQSPNEPNTVEVTCQTGGSPVKASDSAAFSCLSVDLTVDRAVSCNGAAFNDETQVRANNDGTNGCTAVDGQDVNWQYKGCNAGTAPLYACTLVDNNPLVSDPIVVGNLAAGACSANLPATNNALKCSSDLEASEAPDLGKVTMTCCTVNPGAGGIVDCVEANRVSVYDVSTVTCATPSGLNLTKACVDTDGDGTDDKVTVSASATSGDVGFVNCTATDTLYRGGACPSDLDPSAIPLTLDGGGASPFALAPGATQGLFGTIDPALTGEACNRASITCTIAGTSTTESADAAPVTCDFTERKGCFTRTPGFWGTHPGNDARIGTADFLPQEVCGVELNNVLAGNGTSAIEAICSVGRDGRILGSQKTQLVRQCTAAYLNVAATKASGGDCSAETRIEHWLGACCDADSVCTGTDNTETIGACILALDEFNNREDTLLPKEFENPGRANPRYCQDARNNGIVVTPQP